jgi:hypothetical protein
MVLARLLRSLVKPARREPPPSHRNGKALKLHLGCGRTILPGWVNVDMHPLPGVDVVADFDACAATPLPFLDNSAIEFQADHLIEHLVNPLPFMQELHRVAHPDARAVFRLPYGSSDDAFEDPTHRRAYFINSFSYFTQPNYWRADYGYRGDWDVVLLTLVLDATSYQGKSYEETMSDVQKLRNVVMEMVVELRAVKPIRAASRNLLRPTPVSFSYL